jgi:hypothetical protein
MRGQLFGLHVKNIRDIIKEGGYIPRITDVPVPPIHTKFNVRFDKNSELFNEVVEESNQILVG